MQGGVKCTSCGTISGTGSAVCRACGTALATSRVPDETISIATVAGASLPTLPSHPLDPFAVDEERFLPGTLIAGRYRIVALLGRGGMGEVYRATDLTLAQPVALKFLPQSAAVNERLLERFHNEVRVARQVSHPNVCRVYDIGQAEGTPFISMEYIDGEHLGLLLSRIGRLPSDKAVEIVRKICAGLAAAHERGVIHRDLKPQNIVLNRRGDPVIMDFGLAAIASELRGAEARHGTPAYMSPEQLRGEIVTLKSDIYALGLIIYELFTGKRAWDATSLPELMQMQASARPLSITSVASDADPTIEKVVLRCLEQDPAQRPASAVSVAAALPGGDPISAALAAGETPSPELVAASGKTEGIRARYAVSCLLVVLCGMAIWPFARQSTSMTSLVPIQHQLPVLEAKARSYATSFGYGAEPADWVSWYSLQPDLTSWLRETQKPAKQWQQWLRAESPYGFYFRASPRLLRSSPVGVITDSRPAMDEPGMYAVMTDDHGRLRMFRGVAPRYAQVSSPPTLDPNPVLAVAGLDPLRLEEVPPEFAPAVAFDSRRAWKGSHPELPFIPIRVEMASMNGVLTSFHIRWPWEKNETQRESEGQTWQNLARSAVLLAGLVFVVIFVRRNMLLHRGDRQGAFRLACFYFIVQFTANLLVLHPIPDEAMLEYLFEIGGSTLSAAFLMWLVYMAIEPAVRARWPKSMITWSRVLAGRLADARVGSHILIGAAMGTALAYVFLMRTWWNVSNGAPPAGPTLYILQSPRFLIGTIGQLIAEATRNGAIIFFVLCGLRAVVRHDWAAALIASCLLAALDASTSNPWLDVPVYIGVFGIFSFLLLRMGLVPAIVGIFIMNSASRVPAGPEFRSWTNSTALFLVLLNLSIAVYGFWRSQEHKRQRGI